MSEATITAPEAAPALTGRRRPGLGRFTLLFRRIGFYLVAAWCAVTINFALPRMMPGNPADVMISQMSQQQQVTPDQAKVIRNLFGGEQQPLWKEYFSYLNQVVLHGDFGISVTYYPTPVVDIVKTGLWWTILLVGICTVLAFLIGTALGILTGRRPGALLDSLVTPTTIFLHSVPYFWIAMMLALVLGFNLDWLPMTGGWNAEIPIAFSWEFIASALYYAVLPALTILITSVNGWIIGMRNMMVTTIGEDYVLLAEAKGLTPRRVLFGYAARNAMLPQVSSFAMSIAGVLGGSLLTEMVFNYPGLGNQLARAIQSLDYPLMQALFLMLSLTMLVANFIADTVYVLLDPRTREGD